MLPKRSGTSLKLLLLTVVRRQSLASLRKWKASVVAAPALGREAGPDQRDGLKRKYLSKNEASSSLALQCSAIPNHPTRHPVVWSAHFKKQSETFHRPPRSPAPPGGNLQTVPRHPTCLSLLSTRRHFLVAGCVLLTARRSWGFAGTHSVSEQPQRDWAVCSKVTHSSTHPLLALLPSPVRFTLTGLSGITSQMNSGHPSPGLAIYFGEAPAMAQFNCGTWEMAENVPRRFMRQVRIQPGGHLVSFWHLGPRF